MAVDKAEQAKVLTLQATVSEIPTNFQKLPYMYLGMKLGHW